MIICDGDVNQYQALRASRMYDYLIKLDTFVSRIEQQENRGNLLKQPGLAGKKRI